MTEATSLPLARFSLVEVNDAGVPLCLRLATSLAAKIAADLGARKIREELDAGTLVTVGAPWQPEPGSVHAVFPSRRGLLPAVRELLDFMGEAYRENARREAQSQARHGLPVLQPPTSLSD